MWNSPLIEYCNPYHKFSGICKPEECWNGLPKYCYKKEIHVVMVSFAVVFGLLGFCFWLKIFQNFNWQLTFVHAHPALHLGLGFIMEKGFHKKNIHNLFFFQFPWALQRSQEKLKTTAYAKSWGVNKVHFVGDAQVAYTCLHYCAFHKHANSEKSKANQRLRFSLPSIILTDLLGNKPLL